MEEEERTTRAEARAWFVGTLLVGALTVFGAWQSVRRNAKLAEEKHTTEQSAPARPNAPRTP